MSMEDVRVEKVKEELEKLKREAKNFVDYYTGKKVRKRKPRVKFSDPPHVQRKKEWEEEIKKRNSEKEQRVNFNHSYYFCPASSAVLLTTQAIRHYEENELEEAIQLFILHSRQSVTIKAI
jgi:spore germination protein GerM